MREHHRVLHVRGDRGFLSGAVGQGSAASQVFELSQNDPPLSFKCPSSARNSAELSTKCSHLLCCDQLLAALLPNFVLQLLNLSQQKMKLGGSCLHVILCKGRWRRYLSDLFLFGCFFEECSEWGGNTFPWEPHCVTPWILALENCSMFARPSTVQEGIEQLDIGTFENNSLGILLCGTEVHIWQQPGVLAGTKLWASGRRLS